MFVNRVRDGKIRNKKIIKCGKKWKFDAWSILFLLRWKYCDIEIPRKRYYCKKICRLVTKQLKFIGFMGNFLWIYVFPFHISSNHTLFVSYANSWPLYFPSVHRTKKQKIQYISTIVTHCSTQLNTLCFITQSLLFNETYKLCQK